MSIPNDVFYNAVKTKLRDAGVSTQQEVNLFLQGLSNVFDATKKSNVTLSTVMLELEAMFPGQWVSRRRLRAATVRAFKEGALS